MAGSNLLVVVVYDIQHDAFRNGCVIYLGDSAEDMDRDGERQGGIAGEERFDSRERRSRGGHVGVLLPYLFSFLIG